MAKFSRRAVEALNVSRPRRVRSAGAGGGSSVSSVGRHGSFGSRSIAWRRVPLHAAYITVLGLGIVWTQLETVNLVVDMWPAAAHHYPQLWPALLSMAFNTALFRPLCLVSEHYHLGWVWLTTHTWTGFSLFCAGMASTFFIPWRNWYG